MPNPKENNHGRYPGHFAPKDIIRVDVEDGRIVFEQVLEAAVV